MATVGTNFREPPHRDRPQIAKALMTGNVSTIVERLHATQRGIEVMQGQVKFVRGKCR
jgi:hypothetical protein